MNVGQAVCEFYSFCTPPDYIFYIGEALGEASSLIPMRTGEHQLKQLSREERWEEIRAMFRVHTIILDLMDVNPLKIKDEKFRAFKMLQTERAAVVE